MHARQVLGTRRIHPGKHRLSSITYMFGSPVHGTVTPRSVFLAARARDTMDKERETARLETLVNLNLLEVKNTQLQIQKLKLFEEREKKREIFLLDREEVLLVTM